MSSFDPSSLPPCCYTCGEDGHVSSNCPDNNLQPSYPDEERCHYCGRYGHNQLECPQLLPPPPSTDSYSPHPPPCIPSNHTPHPSPQGLYGELISLSQNAIAFGNAEKAENANLRSQITELHAYLATIPSPSSRDEDRLHFLEIECQSQLSEISDLKQQLHTSLALVNSLSSENSSLKEQLLNPPTNGRTENIIHSLKSQLYQSEKEIMNLEEARDFQLMEEEELLLNPPPSLEPLVESLTIENMQLSTEKVVLSSKLTELLSRPLVLRKPRTRNRKKRVTSTPPIREPPVVSCETQEVCVVNLVPESPPDESSSH